MSFETDTTTVACKRKTLQDNFAKVPLFDRITKTAVKMPKVTEFPFHAVRFGPQLKQFAPNPRCQRRWFLSFWLRFVSP